MLGAQAGGYNLVSTGIAVLGTFTAVPISRTARRALEALLGWKLSLHGVPAQGSVTVRVNPAGASYSRFPVNARVPLPRIAGHRDGDATECPGNVLYGELPAIRAGVRRLAPNPTRATLRLAAPPVAPVLIQVPTVSRRGEVVSERTLAETTTDSTGKWELNATPGSPVGGRMWLRALCPGGTGFGAGISDPLHIQASVALTAPDASTPAQPTASAPAA